MKPKEISRRLRFPCGLILSKHFRVGEVEPGDVVHIEFSTEKCFSHRRDCTNDDGHAKSVRYGTSINPHVQVKCGGCVQVHIAEDMELIWVMNKARTKWGDDVFDAYLDSDKAYAVVDRNRETLGYVLLPGAKDEYIFQKKIPWVFLKVS